MLMESLKMQKTFSGIILLNSCAHSPDCLTYGLPCLALLHPWLWCSPQIRISLVPNNSSLLFAFSPMLFAHLAQTAVFCCHECPGCIHSPPIQIATFFKLLLLRFKGLDWVQTRTEPAEPGSYGSGLRFSLSCLQGFSSGSRFSQIPWRTGLNWTLASLNADLSGHGGVVSIPCP